MNESVNPYASPAVEASVVPEVPDVLEDAERIRRQYLSHEASVKSVGFLYYLSGTITGVGMVALLVSTASAGLGGVEILLLGIYLLVAIVMLLLGRGLRALDRRVRIPVAVLSCLGMLWIGIGTIVNGYILYLMVSKKGAMVFSPEYAEIIGKTPHIKYKTSIIVWFFLILLLALLSFGIVAALIA